MEILRQNPDSFAVRAGIQVPHEKDRKPLPLIEAVHGLQNKAHAQGAGRCAYVIKVSVEDPDFTSPFFDIYFAHGANARKHGVIRTASLPVGMFG